MNRYSPEMTKPLRDEVTKLGVKELTSAEEVDATVKDTKGTMLIFINSVCGCAGGAARPGLARALKSASSKPDLSATVFAGQDLEAVERVRKNYFSQFSPSSPCFGLLKDGKLVHMVQRTDIEGRSPEEVAKNLTDAFNKHCKSMQTAGDTNKDARSFPC